MQTTRTHTGTLEDASACAVLLLATVVGSGSGSDSDSDSEDASAAEPDDDGATLVVLTEELDDRVSPPLTDTETILAEAPSDTGILAGALCDDAGMRVSIVDNDAIPTLDMP